MLTHEQLTQEVRDAGDRLEAAKAKVEELRSSLVEAMGVQALADAQYRFAAALVQKSIQHCPADAAALAPSEAKEVCRAEGQ